MSKQIEPKFLFSVDPINKQLYILHRQYPACLILVKQEIPATFIILDLYEDVPENEIGRIPVMPFVQEAKDFFKNYGESIIGGN